MLLADNADHAPIIIDESQPIRIVGKAIKTINEI